MNLDIINIALREYGHREIPGSKHNPEILKYFKDCGFNVNDDETAGCSAFANWVAKETGYERSKKLNARSWLEVGEEIVEPELGDIVVFWRESKNSWKGHVAFYINEVNDFIYTLGGNQGNMVCIAPYNKIKVLGYRRLRKT